MSHKVAGPIVLLTDFGLQDIYVGVMKGVILSLAPAVRLLDLSHEVLPQNVRQAGQILNQSAQYFPKGSIFLTVIDPGVGTSRRAIAIRTRDYYFVGPDNGLLSCAIQGKLGVEVRTLSNKKYWQTSSPSQTFHGRDIFASVAAHLAKNPKCFGLLGKKVKRIVKLEPLKPIVQDKKVLGEIVYFDHFGNAITNIAARSLPGKLNWTRVGRKKIAEMQSNYAQSRKLWVVLINSLGYLEIACSMGSALKKGALKVGQRVVVQCD